MTEELGDSSPGSRRPDDPPSPTLDDRSADAIASIHEPPRWPGWATQVACYVVLAVVMGWGLYLGHRRAVPLDEPIVVDRAKVAQVEQRLDPNVAAWYDLARLPEMGEKTARAIVAFRQQQQARGVPRPFARPEDLANVPGIGPKTVEIMWRYLKFEGPSTWPSRPTG